MVLSADDLPSFVAKSDHLGGPGSAACTDYWADFQYSPNVVVDQALDPFSEEYVSQQLALYHEISGRDFDQLNNEHTVLDVSKHAAAINPYDHSSPAGLAQHLERLSRAIVAGSPPRGGRFLDMGCGWGLSSEVAAYCGMSVMAVDVNPDFVDLVNRRAARLKYDIKAEQGTFDTFESSDRFSMILFYECFHHALRPWTLLQQMARHLEPAGRIVLAGEPINNHWWRYWGLRLDPMSVYCIHKFGWLESGWSVDFLESAFKRAGLAVEFVGSPADPGELTVVGTRMRLGQAEAAEINGTWDHNGWMYEAKYMTSTGVSMLTPRIPKGSKSVSFGFQNYRGRPIALAIRTSAGMFSQHVLPPGRSDIEISAEHIGGSLEFHAETWVPAEEHGSSDNRRISMHLEDVHFL